MSSTLRNPPPFRPRDLDSTGGLFRVAIDRAAARHEAGLERLKRAVQQFKETGSAELELDRLDDECDALWTPTLTPRRSTQRNCARSDTDASKVPEIVRGRFIYGLFPTYSCYVGH
jgi:hypothetical protein